MSAFGEQPAENEESNAVFTPVHQLKDEDRIETQSGEDDENVEFKMRSKLFRFDAEASEWKERGTGDVRILAHKTTGKVRLVMRRDKTFKLCANHYITSDMKLQPNIGSDRSWVWKVAADVSEGTPTAETLAIRFANADNAGQFKTAFEAAQTKNAEILGSGASEAVPPTAPPAAAEEPKVEDQLAGLSIGSKAAEPSSTEPEAAVAAAAGEPEAEPASAPAAETAAATEPFSESNLPTEGSIVRATGVEVETTAGETVKVDTDAIVTGIVEPETEGGEKRVELAPVLNEDTKLSSAEGPASEAFKEDAAAEAKKDD